MNDNELNKLHQTIVPKISPRMGYHRSMPQSVEFGSKFSGGIGITNLRAAQTSVKIFGAVKHIRASTKTGHKFMIITRWAQVCTRTEMLIFKDNRELVHLEGKWAKQLHKEMREIKCKIVTTHKWIQEKYRENNSNIIYEVINSNLVPREHTSTINWCRMYMRQTLISEATTSNGNKLLKYFKDQEPPEKREHNNKFDCPQQSRPNKQSWKIYTT